MRRLALPPGSTRPSERRTSDGGLAPLRRQMESLVDLLQKCADAARDVDDRLDGIEGRLDALEARVRSHVPTPAKG